MVLEPPDDLADWEDSDVPKCSRFTYCDIRGMCKGYDTNCSDYEVN